jgi:hypothetical protein
LITRPSRCRHPRQDGTGRAQNTEHISVKESLRLVKGERFGNTGGRDARIVDEYVDAAGLLEHRCNSTLDGIRARDVEIDDLEAQILCRREATQRLGMLPVLASDGTH